ncbi:hypothetical protein LZC95_18140 [Pendulispora brunnea]|uniref:Uncharacterized protein n=1 Tax=Pendulispora brunnea TaxID=2905690 RepID=A0ABZ2KN28_9BACT
MNEREEKCWGVAEATALLPLVPLLGAVDPLLGLGLLLARRPISPMFGLRLTTNKNYAACNS